MRFPWKYIQIDGEWYIEENGHTRLATPEGWMDVLVDDEWHMGSITKDEAGKWMVYSNVLKQAWELKEVQWAFYRPGPYDWVHPKRPKGKCFCDIYRSVEENRFNEEELGTIIMDLAHYPFKKELWNDNGIFIQLKGGYIFDIDIKRSMIELGYDEDVFFWSW